MAFSQEGPRTVCILSANGAICNATLRQPALSGGTVAYEVGATDILCYDMSHFNLLVMYQYRSCTWKAFF